MNEKTKRIAGTSLFIAIVFVLQHIASAIRFGPFSITLVLAPIIVGAAIYGISTGALLGFEFGLLVLLPRPFGTGDAAAFFTISPIPTVIVVLLKGTLAGLCAGLVFKAIENAAAKNSDKTAKFASPIVGTAVFSVGYGLIVSFLINQKLAEKLGDYTALAATAASVAIALISCLISVVIYDTVKKDSKLGAVVIAGITAPVVNTGIFIIGSVLFFMPIINEWAAGAGVESAGVFMITGIVGFNFIFELAINLLLSTVIVRLIKIGRKTITQ